MLKLFEVSGFKNFLDPITLNFADARDYKFNHDCVADGLISKLIIYGKNAIGKSNFGWALFDIAPRYQQRHPSMTLEEDLFDPSYLNVLNSNGFAEFRYVFQFEDQQIEYLNKKNYRQKLIYEKVIIDNELIFAHDRENPGNCNTEGIAKMSPTLLLDFDKVSSVFNYVGTSRPKTSQKHCDIRLRIYLIFQNIARHLKINY